MDERIKKEFEGRYGKYIISNHGIDLLKSSGELVNISPTQCIVLSIKYTEDNKIRYKLCFKDTLGNECEQWRSGTDLLTAPGIKKLIKAGINFDKKHPRFATEYFHRYLNENINCIL